MAEMLLCDRLDELWLLIDQQHLLYMELDESPRKIDQREKLESYIKEYLCIAPHDKKFSFRETAEILHRSASTKDNFSGYRASVAWRAIGKYADNLVAQPWRKEYRDIKLYCGFYKHEIEESLVGAELMFEAMGYRHAGHSTMTLPDVLDPDRVTSVSKDAIVAYVECQILKQIWETLSSHYNFTWLEILEFRENHTGTPDQAIRALTYKYRQRQYQEQSYHRPQHLRTDLHHPARSDCMSMGYYSSHMHYPSHPYTLPVQPRYCSMISPQQVAPPPMVYPPPMHPPYAPQNIIKAQDLYPSNGYHVHPHYVNPHMVHNGYSVPVYPPPVPTGQLIEIDSTQPHNECEAHPSRSSNKYHQEEPAPRWHSVPEMVKIPENPPVPSGKAKEDGAGSWENWDYVYRNLETNKKDPRSNLISPNHSGDHDAEAELSEKLKKTSLERTETKPTDTTNKTRAEGDGEARVRKDPCETEVDNSKYVIAEAKPIRTSPDKPKRRTSESSSSTSLLNIKVNLEPETEQEPKGKEKTPEKMKLDVDKWECITCTYLNPAGRDICEMCYKSKERGSELKPQPSGGQECPKCTLVNEPGLSYCAACNASLKDSPTYI